MIPPEKAILIETTTTTCWLDENGILMLKTKNVERTIENYNQLLNLLKKLGEKNKVCVIADMTNITELNKETREYLSKEFPKYMKAMALISGSPLGRMVSNSFIVLQPGEFPVKIFTNVNEAVDWLKQYL